MISDVGGDTLQSQLVISQDTDRIKKLFNSECGEKGAFANHTRNRNPGHKLNTVLKSAANPFSSTKASELSEFGSARKRGKSPMKIERLGSMNDNDYGTV